MSAKIVEVNFSLIDVYYCNVIATDSRFFLVLDLKEN